MTATATKRFIWPAPPFSLHGSEPPLGQGRDCTVELADGSEAHGELREFDPAAESIELHSAGKEGTRSIRLAQVQRLCLTRALELVADTPTIEAVGAARALADHERNFRLRFHGGREVHGRTRGFVKDSTGLFLFPVERGLASPSSCFTPAAALDDVQIGPLIGEALAARKAMPTQALEAALGKQAAMRGERLGQYLSDRAIVSRDLLARALEEQTLRPNVRLGELLLESGIITQDQLDMALAAQAENRQRRLGEILVDIGAVTKQQIQAALADKLGIPLINVREFTVDTEALGLVQSGFARRHGVLPLIRSGQSLVVAVENPLATDFVQPLRFATGLAIVPVMADPDDLRVRIALEYAALDGRAMPFNWDDKDALTIAPTGEGAGEVGPDVRVEDLASQLAMESPGTLALVAAPEHEARVADSTLVKLVNKMILDAHAQGASDIHIEANPGRRNTRIRFRRDGRLEDYLELEPAYRNALVSRVKIMASMDISEHRRAQDGKIDFSRFGPLPIELRVAIIPTANGLEDIVMRILSSAEPLPMDALAFSANNLATLETMVRRSYGLVLVCGPTGSGKTTTLHSLLGHINHPDIKIWTAEDPIEITQAGIRQVQMNARVGWTFATAMRAFLRADPDVIMVGEMRDEETTKIGIEASLTGHLVFSTLHTNSAAESIVRLLDLGMDPFNFADALIGILSQRLARRLCPHCRKPRVASEDEIAELAEEYCIDTDLQPAEVIGQWRRDLGKNGRLTLHEAAGCSRCREGYKGRIGIHELLSASPRIKVLIHARATAPQIEEAAQREGMVLLKQDAIAKVLQGEIDLASARAASS